MIQACSDAPTKIERDNLNDPEVFGFVLNPVQDISTSILEDKVIEVEWTDSSKVPTHYILKKKLRFSDNYIAIDTLNKDTRKFYDASGEITKDTKYEIISLRKQENGEEVFSQGINSGIDFGGFVSTSQNYNADTTAIIFNWEFETNWPFTAIVTTYDNELEREVVLDTLSNTNTYTTPAFEKDFQYKYFDLKFFVSNRNIDLEKPYKTYTGDYHILDFLPEITNIEVISEGKVVINWEDNTGFEDGFRLLRSKGVNRNSAREREVIAELGPNVTSYTDTLNPITGYTRDEFGRESNIKTYYGILVYKNDTQTGTFGAEVQFTPPEVTMNISNMTSNSFRVSWSTTHSDKIDSFILQKSIDGKNFHDFKYFPKHSTGYTEYNLDKTTTHYFRFKSITSAPSETIGLSFSPSLVEKDYFPYEGVQNFRFSESGSLLAAAKGSFFDPFELGVSVYDLNSKSVIYSKNLLNSSIHGIDIHESNDKIAVGSRTDKSVAVYDFVADTLIYRKDDISVFDVKFSNDGNTVFSNSETGVLTKHNLKTGHIDFSKMEDVSGSQAFARKLDLSPSGDSIAYSLSGFLNISDTLGNTIEFNNVSNLEGVSQHVSFSKKGSYLSVINLSGGAFIFNAKSNDRYFEFSSRYLSIDKNEKLAIGSYGADLYLIDLENRRLLNIYTFENAITNITFSPSENIFAVGTNSGVRFYSFSTSNTWKKIEGDFYQHYPNY